MSPNADKRALRAELRRTRAALDHRAGRQARLLEHGRAARRGARVIAGYAALGDEADPAELLAAWSDAEVVYPRVEGPELRWLRCPPSALVAGSFGVREPPADAPEVAPEAIDLFLVPGLGFTAEGARIGYGKGFYDRALAAARPDAVRLGIAFEVQIVKALPTEPHDRFMHGLLTDAGLRWIVPRAG